MRRRWRVGVGAPVALGIVAGVLTTSVLDRSWGWELVARCVTFSLMYVAIRPVVERSRRRAGERDARHLRDIERAA